MKKYFLRVLSFYKGSISRQVTFIYLSFTLVIILIMSIISLFFIPRIFLKNYLSTLNNSFEISSTNLSNIVSNIDISMSSLLESEEGFIGLLNTGYDNIKDASTNFKNAETMLTNAIRIAIPSSDFSYKAIFFVDKEMSLSKICPDHSYYTTIGSKLGNSIHISQNSAIQELLWFHESQKRSDSFYWFCDGESNLIYGAKQYALGDSNMHNVKIQNIGILFFAFDPQSFIKQIRANNGTQNSVITFQLSDETVQIGTLNNAPYYQYEKELSSGLNVKIQTLKFDILQIAFIYILYLFLTMMIIILGAVLVVKYISKSVTRPIVALSEHMKNQQALTPVSTAKLSKNEILDIYDNYNYLLKRVEILIQENKDEVEKRKKQEFAMHQMQINPHFIYNTLNTFSCYLMLKEENEIVNALNSLTNYLRYNYNDPDIEVSIAQEIEQLKSYIQIQNIKFNDKIVLNVEVSNEHMNLKIIKMLLQPLVENAINYGIGIYSENIIVRVYSYIESDSLKLCIANNAICEDVHKINEHIQGTINISQNSGGLGTRNINERLVIKYGYIYGLKYSITDTETIACLTLPINTNLH